jgi:hypothetical protein
MSTGAYEVDRALQEVWERFPLPHFYAHITCRASEVPDHERRVILAVKTAHDHEQRSRLFWARLWRRAALVGVAP